MNQECGENVDRKHLMTIIPAMEMHGIRANAGTTRPVANCPRG